VIITVGIVTAKFKLCQGLTEAIPDELIRSCRESRLCEDSTIFNHDNTTTQSATRNCQ